jgi:uncharacterized protein YicC (UPF0701 family)
MISPHLQAIERDIRTLSLAELEWLLELIAKQVQDRKQTSAKFTDMQYMKEELATMANDLDIQAEIASINSEFSITEIDGL